MKRFWIAALAAGVIGTVLTGCATTKGISDTAVNKTRDESNTVVQANKKYIRDWKGSLLNIEAQPAWLGPTFLGDYSVYKAHFGIDAEDVVRESEATGADVRGAQLRADVNYARKIAKEFHQSVSNFVADRARSGADDKVTSTAVEEALQAQSSVEITGHEKRTEFYHIVDVEDALTGKMTRKCVMYQVYVIPAKTWARTFGTYLRKVLGDMPEEVSVDEKFVQDLVAQMMYDARFPKVMTQEEKKQELEYSRKVLDAQIDLAPAEQKAAAQQAVVKIVQDAQTERTKVRANAQTQQVQSLAEAQTMAAMSGNPAVHSAALITPDDKDWLDAASLAMDIIFN